jgi:hypothetical protein
MYACDEEVKEAICNFSDYICDETLAVSVEEGTPMPSSSEVETTERGHIYEKSWKIGAKKVYLAIKPLHSIAGKD